MKQKLLKMVEKCKVYFSLSLYESINMFDISQLVFIQTIQDNFIIAKEIFDLIRLCRSSKVPTGQWIFFEL